MDNNQKKPRGKKVEEPEATEGKKGPKWGLLIPLIVILTICGSVGGTVLATHFLSPDATSSSSSSSSVNRNIGSGKLGEGEKLVTVSKFVVNLTSNDSSTHYVQLKIALLVSSSTKAKELKKNMPIVRDAVISVVKKKQASDLLNNTGSVTALKNELKSGINEELGESIVEQVYVTQLVVK